ncbi:MAG: M20/M25/M40 family metallo-hydrolase [Deltaproteobacteria bacterium]|nr:M20/M25/M40 family metallo-hydrolase [Deltaproteobacteria bacterium]
MSATRYLCGAVLLLAACAASTPPEPPPTSPPAALARLDAAAVRIAAASAESPDFGWQRLTTLADLYGPRITGSPELTQALAWAAEQMRADGLDAVRLQPVMVPHWVRGAEQGRIVQPIDRPMALLGLGGTVGTSGRLRAPLVGFDSLDALRASTARLDGTIAFVNHRLPPFDAAHDDPGYRQGVQARLHAASQAATRGARAVLVRSVTAVSLRTPHTGALLYDAGAPKIPAAAVSIEDADLLARLLQRGAVEVELSLGAHQLPDAPSANAIGELRGRERPDEIVLLGAHIDSWDVGQGASDDGAGCVAVMEALRLLRRSGLTPRRTVRVVLFTGEEYGLAGARAYHRQYGREPHVAAFETDYGMGAPDALGVGNEARVQAMAPLLPAFARFDIRRFLPHAYGADVEPIVSGGAAGYDLEPDGRHYFDIHHTAADTLDKIRPEDLRRNAAAIALLAYYLAEE